MKLNNEKTQEIGKLLLRIGISLLFIWFGISQLANPNHWLGFLPAWTNNLPITQVTFVYLNGSAEIILALFLIAGLYTRTAAIILALHLLGIALSMSYSPTMIRDLGLAIATGAIFLNGPDKYTLDKKLSGSQELYQNTSF
ncbi:MAG: DoxX family protein [Nanoarchaeota archaeon]